MLQLVVKLSCPSGPTKKKLHGSWGINFTGLLKVVTMLLPVLLEGCLDSG